MLPARPRCRAGCPPGGHSPSPRPGSHPPSIRKERICFSLSSRLMWMALSGSSPCRVSAGQGLSQGTIPDPPPWRALPSWVGKWTPGREQSRAEANTLREARHILSVLEGRLHTGSRWGFLQPMSDSGLVGDWSPGPPTKMGVGGKGSRGSPLCFSMTEGHDHPQSRRYPDAQDGPSRHAYTHTRTHTQASGTRKMPAQRYRPSRSTVGPMPPPGDWPAGGCGLASMIQGAEARCPPSLPTSG